MKRWIIFSVLFALFGAASPTFAAGFIIVDDAQFWPGPRPPHPHPIPEPWQPRPMPPRRYAFAPLEVNYVKVHTRITDQVAITAVDQEFYNPNPSQLEGTFVFPVPKGAHIDKFTMEINGKQVQAELLSADRARGIYEDIVRRLKDPALLEYAGRDMFKVRIFPIEPTSRKRITLSYTQLLKSADGLVSYVLPLNTQKFSARPIKNVSVKVDLESKRPLKSIYSPSHTVEVKRHDSHSATAGYEASDVQPDTDFALYFAPEKDEIGLNLLTHKTSGEDGYFLLLASPGLDVEEKQVVSKDVVCVLDTSGSMAGKKLEQAKKALQFFVESLNDGDRFEIIRFSTEVEPLFDKLVEASPQNRDRAQAFIKDLKAIGATAIDDALRKALDFQPRSTRSSPALRDNEALTSAAPDRPFAVIFLTDGRPTIGTTDEDEIVSRVKQRGQSQARVFCFGIGTDVNTHLLDRITEETRAVSEYVLPDEDLEVKVSNFISQIKAPVLANPALKFTGDVRATRLYPSPLPDLFKGEQVVMVGRYSGHGDSAVIIDGTVNGSQKSFSYDSKFPEDNSENEFIPRLWATRRVGYLLDEIRLHGESSELRDEVAELARKYGIVTPYTAYLIVEDESRRDVPAPMRSLRTFGGDKDARHEAAKSWNEFKNERDGEKAIGSARSGMLLKSADAAGPASASGARESRRALGLASPSVNTPGSEQAADGRNRLVQYAQQTRFVSGKNFFQNDQQWIDSAVQKSPNAKHIRIQFNSSDYFTFVAKHPQSLPWLALGQNVQFVLDNTIYEIYE